MKASLIALSASLFASPALAAGSGDASAGETVLVTGTRAELQSGGRLDLNPDEMPATIDILTQEDFQIEGARSAIEAMNAAPGVLAGNLHGSVGSVSMRGFHRATNYLYDGVRMANSDVALRNWDSWSFDRIEVIKGPDSVTSGEGALAGAINFVPRRPSLHAAAGELLASYGSFDTVRIAGDVNLPVEARAAMRASASYARSSGWIDDGDSDSLAATFSFLVEPTAGLSITLSADYFEDDFSTAYYGTPLVPRDVARDPSRAVSGSAGLVLDRAMRRVNFDVTDGRVGSDSLWLRARAAYRLSEGWRLTGDTSWYHSSRLWRDADEYVFNAVTGLVDRGLSLITHEHRFWNQRVSLSSDGRIGGRRNRFAIGIEAGGTDFFTRRRFGRTAGVDPFEPVRGVFPADTPADFATRQDVEAEVGAVSVFAENAFDLTADWLLVGGLRYDDIRLDRRVTNATSGAASSYGQDYHPVTWRVGTVYTLRPRTQLYAHYSRAVTPIGGLLFLSAANAAFDLTTGESWEAGIKAPIGHGRVQMTASVFHIRQDDILTRDPADPAIVFQGGSQISTGAEATLSWTITEELAARFSATLLEAELVDLVEAGGIDRSGNRPPNVPERLADLVVTYRPQALPVAFTGIVRHNGAFYTANANTIRVNASTTFDAAVAWEAPFGTLTLRGRNLADSFHAEWSGYAAGLVFVAAPRSFELSFTRRF
ncbi:TonB-dependent receptor [Sphingosinicella terrae]|uniref:TonB-dependent receptor n=1 Tax=Sphingosinicella terrae TaxID=2172047 RepID=UPI000E0DEAB5|nr:TonB-dependent receptor [Sphingosinicella terrae]